MWACETDKNEAIKIGTLIHDVLNGISDVQIKNDVVKNNSILFKNFLLPRCDFYIFLYIGLKVRAD